MTEEEIYGVAAPAGKAPGIDGFGELFYSAFWNIIKVELGSPAFLYERRDAVELEEDGYHAYTQREGTEDSVRL